MGLYYMSRELTPERVELINEAEKLWERGFSASEIGERLGQSKNLIAGIARNYPERFPTRSQAFISAKIAESNKRNAAPTKVKEEKVAARRASSIENEALIDDIKKLRDDGDSVSQISIKLNITKSRIAGIMHRNRDIFPATTTSKKKLPIEKRKTRSEIYQDSKARKEAIEADKQKKLRDSAIERAISRKAEEVLDKSLHDIFVEVDAAGSVVTTLMLKDSMCKYPVAYSDDVEGKHIYCGVPRNAEWGSPYCSAHHRICYNPIPVRVR